KASATSEMTRITHRALFSKDPKTALIGPPSWARTPCNNFGPPSGSERLRLRRGRNPASIGSRRSADLGRNGLGSPRSSGTTSEQEEAEESRRHGREHDRDDRRLDEPRRQRELGHEERDREGDARGGSRRGEVSSADAVRQDAEPQAEREEDGQGDPEGLA